MANQFGFTERNIKGDKTLFLNDTKLTSTMEGTNKYGTYVKVENGKSVLYHDGIPLVQSENSKSSINGSDGSFGEVKLNTQGRTCINITIDNYNKLLRGELVTGYKLYDRKEVYNLVDNPSTAPMISYTEEPEGYRFGDILWTEKNNVVYNNVVGISGLDYQINHDNNIFYTDCPYIDVRYFNPVIVDGDRIHLTYRVSDLKNSLFNYDTIGPRYESGNLVESGIYKVILRTEDGDEIVKYSYAGTMCIDTPIFRANGEDRQTWFSIECIDSRGVASIQQFLDVYVRAQEHQPNYLKATDSLLKTFEVTYDGDEYDNISAYRNKRALTNLFQYAKDIGKNGIILPKHTYYLDYHNMVGKNVVDDTPISNNTFKFYHFSDIHGCLDTLNKVEELMSDADNTVDAAILTGDMSDGFGTTTTTNARTITAVKDLSSKLNGKLLIAYGNHDRQDMFGNNSSNTGTAASRAATSFLHEVLGDNVEWGDKDKNPIGSYWYRDYKVKDNATLRIVGIDSYAYINNHNAGRYKTAYSQDQVDWFIKCLKGSVEDGISALTENDYLLIAMHEPPVNYTTEENINLVHSRGKYNWCSTKSIAWATSEYNGELFPIIVDAYLRKTSVNETVRNVAEGITTTMPSVQINTTFTGEPCIFLGYLCGHVHADIVREHPKYPNQLILCVDCATNDTEQYGNASDIVNRTTGVLMNEVTLDFDTHRIIIQRVGQSETTSYTIDKSKTNDQNDLHDNRYTYPSVTRTSITFPFQIGVDNLTMPVDSYKVQHNINLGTQKYYYAKIKNKRIVKENDKPVLEEISLEDIINDTKQIFRYPKGTGYSDIQKLAKQNTIAYIGDKNWYSLSKESLDYLKDNILYLRTFKRDVESLIDSEIELPDVVADRELYFVHNTASGTEYNAMYTSQFIKNNNLVFPDHFTVDINGSRFVAAYTDDIDKGGLIRFYYNLDTHIISSTEQGKFEGLYERYNFLNAHIKTAHNVIGEHQDVYSVIHSRFCSIDNIDISRALGYDCTTKSWGIQGGKEISLVNGKYINEQGAVVSTPEQLVTSEFMDLGTNHGSDFSIGRSGYVGYTYCGKRREVHIAFYNSSKQLISIIKSKLYQSVKIPKNTRYVRFTGYGKVVSSTTNAIASNWVIKWKDQGTIYGLQPVFSVGCNITNCYLHDSRTVAFGNPQGRQLLYDNITFERCANTRYLGVSSGGSITPTLGDFEDSWQWAKYVTMSNCTYIPDPEKKSSGHLIAYNCEHFNYINNKNISLKQGGGIESGIIKDSYLTSWEILRTRSCFHPQVEYSDNIVNSLSVTTTLYDSTKIVVVEDDEDQIDVIDIGGDGQNEEGDDTLKFDEIDVDYNDRMEPVISFSNCTFKRPIRYGDFKLRKSSVDVIKLDYFY